MKIKRICSPETYTFRDPRIFNYTGQYRVKKGEYHINMAPVWAL